MEIIFTFLSFTLYTNNNRKSTVTSKTSAAPRMWSCTKCSYAYNPLWIDVCEICSLQRPTASLTQPSLITVTKDKPNSILKVERNNQQKNAIKLQKEMKMSKSQSGICFDEIAAIDEAPIASFEQDLDDLSGDSPSEWTCKKCTLLNSIENQACIVCGGSKLKSISAIEDMTLRKGEFWTCVKCTLKNSLSVSDCAVCKTSRPAAPAITTTPAVSVPQTTNYQVHATGQPNHVNRKTTPVRHSLGATNISQKIIRSPSPKHNRNVSGAIPKVSVSSALQNGSCLLFF